MRLATGGTVEATELAIKNGWAINLSGGYHHAKKDDCDGFCVYADAPLAAYKAINEHNINKILVIDLDAHQGNGNEAIFGEMECFKNKVDVFDVYGQKNYPGFWEHQLMSKQLQPTWYDHPVTLHQTNDTTYLSILTNHLPSAIRQTNPGLIIYNAGTDIYEKDPLGRLKITKEGIIERDRYVFEQARKKNIPIVMILSGGYTADH
jgi:histone deacetylase 11